MPAEAGPTAAETTAAADNDSKAGPGTEDSAGLRGAVPPGETVIAGERAHLRRSRELLHLMRENVLTLAENPMAGDRVSLEYLKADLYRRAEALKDLPDAPLFFGRLDYSELAKTDEDFAGARRGVLGVVPPGEHCILDGATCTTRTGLRSSSTGGPRCRGPSTGPARPTRWASRCGGGSVSPGERSPPMKTSGFRWW